MKGRVKPNFLENEREPLGVLSFHAIDQGQHLVDLVQKGVVIQAGAWAEENGEGGQLVHLLIESGEGKEVLGGGNLFSAPLAQAVENHATLEGFGELAGERGFPATRDTENRNVFAERDQ